jgi:PIN domain nuclease of toxin-antitoxin system
MTTYLVDTHVAIWFVTGDERISSNVRDAMRAPDTDLLISVVSGWEYMQKLASRPERLPVQVPFEEIVRRLKAVRIDLEYQQHTYAYTLPMHHTDPFDRMLIAQALDRGVIIMTRDRLIRQYDVPTFW